MEKEYEKLTADQFHEFLQTLPGVLAMLREMNEHLARTPAAKFDSVTLDDYDVDSQVYELPFIQHLSLIVA